MDTVLVDDLPELGFLKNVGQSVFGFDDGSIQTTQKPFQPLGNIGCTALLPLQLSVVILSFRFNLAGKTVATASTYFRSNF